MPYVGRTGSEGRPGLRYLEHLLLYNLLYNIIKRLYRDLHRYPWFDEPEILVINHSTNQQVINHSNYSF